MEIENAISQDLESLGREKFFKMAMENFWIFVWKNSKKYVKYRICYVNSFYFL